MVCFSRREKNLIKRTAFTLQSNLLQGQCSLQLAGEVNLIGLQALPRCLTCAWNRGTGAKRKTYRRAPCISALHEENSTEPGDEAVMTVSVDI